MGPCGELRYPSYMMSGAPQKAIGLCVVSCESVRKSGFLEPFFVFYFGVAGFLHVFSQPSADFSKLLIDVQSRGSTPQPLQELDAKFRRMWHEMLTKSWGKVNNARLTTHHTSPHPISLMNRGPTDGIGLGSASSCVSWPRQASASCDVPGLVEIQWYK